MVVFYRGPCVRITHRAFETWCPAYRRYLIEDLKRVHVVKWAVDPPAAVSASRIGSASVAGAAAIAFALSQTEGWQAVNSLFAKLVLIVLVVVSVAVSSACWRIKAVEYELVADHRGDRVTLYKSSDTSGFDQVRRALVRSLEWVSDAR
jgi:hypothetical protein